MPYAVKLTEEFQRKALKFFKRHPDAFERYKKTMVLLSENPFHPSLRLHKLQSKKSDYHSVSITMSYRMIIEFMITENEIIPLDIGTHDEVY
jgi:proteic killer suppression protein